MLNIGANAFPNSFVATPRVHHRQRYRQQRGKHPFYSAPRSTEIISVAHRLSRPNIIGRHSRASNEMIHGDFGIMILILRLRMEHYVRKYSSPSDPQVPQGWASQKRLFLGGQTGGSANRKKKSTLKILIQFDMCFP